MANAAELIDKVKDMVNGALEVSEDGSTVYAARDNIINLLRTLKEKLGFDMLADMTSVDYEDRFEMIYYLMNLNAEIAKVNVKLPKDSPKTPTVVALWKAADVQEREIFDLMGIQFEGHGNLTRILMPDDFEGHPLRKDFKVEAVNRF